MENVAGLFLDGHQVDPNRTNTTPSVEEDAESGEFDYYRVVVGVLTLHFFLDEKSSVKIDSTAYLELEIPEDNDDDIHAWVSLKASNSYRDAFTGSCVLQNASTNRCTIVNSDISRSSAITGMRYPLVNMGIVDSRLENATISDGASIHSSSIINSDVHTPGTGAIIEGTILKNSSLSSGEDLVLSGSRFVDTGIHAAGVLRIQDGHMHGLYLKPGDCDIPDRFHFFIMDLPKVMLCFYQTASGEPAITRQGGGFDMQVNDPEFKQKLTELMVECEQPLPEDAVQYVLDSVASRLKLTKLLNERIPA